MQKHYDLPQGRATQVVKNEDKRRFNLYKKLGKTDYDNAELYHLVLNMNRVHLDQALELVTDLVNVSKSL
jgi:cytidylate kinase